MWTECLQNYPHALSPSGANSDMDRRRCITPGASSPMAIRSGCEELSARLRSRGQASKR